MPIERVHFWGISAVWLFYVLAAISVIIFLAGVYYRVSVWMVGRRNRGSAGPVRARGARAGATRWARLALDGLLGRRIFSGDLWAGLMHAFIMWGFIGLFVGTVLATIDHWFVHFLTSDTYLVYSFCLEIFGLMLTAGLLIAFARRYVVKVARLDNQPQDLWILVLLFFCVLSGFVVEGTRLAAETPDWEGHSFTGLGLASWLPADGGAEAFYPYIWWFHAVICLALVAYFPFSKLFHSLAAPVNIYLAPEVGGRVGGAAPAAAGVAEAAGTAGDGAGGVEAETVGGPRFSFRDLANFSGCTRCGRCNEVCPSTSAQEPFAPREFIAQANAFTRIEYNPLCRVKWFRERLTRAVSAAPRISPEQIWFCTTCRACLEVCPVYIGALEPIREVRVAEVEEGSRMGPMLISALETLYRFNNPWEPSKRKRSEWPVGLTVPGETGTPRPVTVPDLTEGARADLCYWVGCTTSFDTRAQKLARAFTRIMAHAGVSFATLGQKETCCGDIARRVGEQGLFEEQVEKTTALFQRYGVCDVVTSSPHCFNLMRNEYPWRAAGAGAPEPGAAGAAPSQASAGATGAPPRVRHYTQVLEELLDEGRLAPVVTPAGGPRLTVTFHDPCYLGRYNHIYEAPRRLIRSIPGVDLVEMAHHGPDSLCCGGGGGRLWQELEGERKLAEVRIEEAAATGADVVVTACPYCLIMLEDAVKTADLDGRLKVMDLNELLAESLGLGDDAD